MSFIYPNGYSIEPNSHAYITNETYSVDADVDFIPKWEFTYKKPVISNSSKIDRFDSKTGTISDSGDSAKLLIDWFVDANWVTAVSITIKYRLYNVPKEEKNTFTSVTIAEGVAGKTSGRLEYVVNGIDDNKEYYFEVVLKDNCTAYGTDGVETTYGTNDELKVVLPKYIFDVDYVTENIGIGGPADDNYKLRVNGNIIADNFKDVHQAYPVGAIYMSVDPTSPASLFGGFWEELQNRFLLGAGSSYEAGATGGESTHTLTVSEMPSHSHSVNAVTTGNPSANHYHGYSGSTGTVSSNHRHNTGGLSDNGTGTTGSGPNFTNGVLITESWGWRHNSNYITNNHTHGYSGNTGGVSAWHTHTVPAHDTNKAGSSGAHNNMPPYLVVYMWKKVAEDDGTTMTITGNLGAMEAKGYMDQASTSAANAKTSESSASSSASSAKTSATNASKSESNANTSAVNAKTSETNAKKYYDNLVSTSMATYQATLYSVTVATGDWTSTNGSYVATKSISGIKSTSKLKSLDLASDQVSSNYASAAESGYAMIVSAETLDGSIKFTAHSKPTVELHLEALVWNK